MSNLYKNTVEPPLMATSLTTATSLHAMATFFCPQGGHCREIQLYSVIKLSVVLCIIIQ